MNGMIFAAGLGTRLRPLTNDRPKALVAYNGKTLLQRVIEKMKQVGIERLVINVHHFADQIERFLQEHANFGMDIRISDERKLLLDTGGGILKARDLFIPDKPVLVHNVDIWTDVNLMKLVLQHDQSKAYATLVVTASQADRVLRFDDRGILCGWENRKSGEQKVVNEAFYGASAFNYCGIQILSAAYLEHITHRGVFSIIDEHLLQARQRKLEAFLHQGFCLDLGTPEAIRQATLLEGSTAVN